MKRVVRFVLSGLLTVGIAACQGGAPAQPTPMPTATPTLRPTPTMSPTATPTATPAPTPTPTPITTAEIKEPQVARQGDMLQISFQFSGQAGDYNAFHIFIDADQSPATGYRISGTGAELLLENGGLFTYKGDGSSWRWEPLPAPSMIYEVIGNNVKWEVKIDELKLSKARAIDVVAQLVNKEWNAAATTPRLTFDLSK